MIQFNLLPDVKVQYVKAQRTKYLLTLISILVSAVSLAVLFFAFITVHVVQKKSLSDLNKDISSNSSQLRSVKDLNKILTVQNQLSTLTSLHDAKPVTSRLFDYITQVTPAKATLNQASIDFTANTLSIGGSADSLDTISVYTDTLKHTTYTLTDAGQPIHAFSNVVLANFGRDDKGATFTITCSFDPAIFNINNTVKLTVPKTSESDMSNVFGEGK